MRLLLFSCLVLALTSLAGDTPNSRQVARYRLLHARVSVQAPTGEMLPVETVFKLDSQTGDTWLYKAKTSVTNITEGWSKLHDL